MAEENSSEVYTKHKIQYITDERTGRLKRDPFNFNVRRESLAREKRVSKIKEQIHKYDNLTDEELTQKSLELHQRAKKIVKMHQRELDHALADGSTTAANKIRKQIDDEIKERLLDDSFAIVSAAVKREKGFDLHDSQINAALVLCDENIAEMRCGGGKTIMQFLPAYFNTLTLDHHFVITPNDYLKYEGYIEAKKVFDHLGMSVGIMPVEVLKKGEREKVKEESHKDIVYTTSAALAHSMLADRMANPVDRMLPSKSMSASVDEIDQIVLDNARTPFVISQSGVNMSGGLEHLALDFISSDSFKYHEVDGLAKVKDLHYISSTDVYDPSTKKFKVDLVLDPTAQTFQITDLAYEHLKDYMEKNPFFQTLTPQDRTLFQTYYVPNAIRAKFTMKRNEDYLVDENGKIVVYNAATGRKVKSSEYSRGIHSALEAKEGLKVHPESIAGDEMSILDMIHKFDKVSGCSGTVRELNDYFEERFGKCVREIPAPPSNAINEAPIYFLHKEAKTKYICDDIVGRVYKEAYMGDNLKFQPGAPIMIVATSKAEADALYESLKNSKLQCDVRKITADNSDEEMSIFAQSGRKGVITVSTLMAGRGTDVKLGGAPAQAASAEVCSILKKTGKFNASQLSEIRANLDSNSQDFFNDSNNQQIVSLYNRLNQQYTADMKGEKEEVNNLGGLCVISTDFINSERGQRQLLSRAARQNDNGSTVQFISFEDEGFIGSLLKSSDIEEIERMLEQAGYDRDTPITPSMGKIYKKCQKIVEKCRRGYDANQAASIMKSDPYLDVVQKNGDYFREGRDLVYSSEHDPIEVMKTFIQQGIEDNVNEYMQGDNPAMWDLKGLRRAYYGVLTSDESLIFNENQLKKLTPQRVASVLTNIAFSRLSLDHPENLKPEYVEKLKTDYFNSFGSALASFSIDASGYRCTTSITPQLSQEQQYQLYLTTTQGYFDYMKNAVSFEFLVRARGIDLTKLETSFKANVSENNPAFWEKQGQLEFDRAEKEVRSVSRKVGIDLLIEEHYSTKVKDTVKRTVDSYLKTKPTSKDEEQHTDLQKYTTETEQKALKAGMTLSDYVAYEDSKLSPNEKEKAFILRMQLSSFDPENQNIYASLKPSCILSLAKTCQNIPLEDFYTMYNGARKTMDRYFGWKLADAMYDSGFEKEVALQNKYRILGKFYQFTIGQNRYQDIVNVAVADKSYGETQTVNVESPSFKK